MNLKVQRYFFITFRYCLSSLQCSIYPQTENNKPNTIAKMPIKEVFFINSNKIQSGFVVDDIFAICSAGIPTAPREFAKNKDPNNMSINPMKIYITPDALSFCALLISLSEHTILFVILLSDFRDIIYNIYLHIIIVSQEKYYILIIIPQLYMADGQPIRTQYDIVQDQIGQDNMKKYFSQGEQAQLRHNELSDRYIQTKIQGMIQKETVLSYGGIDDRGGGTVTQIQRSSALPRTEQYVTTTVSAEAKPYSQLSILEKWENRDLRNLTSSDYVVRQGTIQSLQKEKQPIYSNVSPSSIKYDPTYTKPDIPIQRTYNIKDLQKVEGGGYTPKSNPNIVLSIKEPKQSTPKPSTPNSSDPKQLGINYNSSSQLINQTTLFGNQSNVVGNQTQKLNLNPLSSGFSGVYGNNTTIQDVWFPKKNVENITPTQQKNIQSHKNISEVAGNFIGNVTSFIGGLASTPSGVYTPEILKDNTQQKNQPTISTIPGPSNVVTPPKISTNETEKKLKLNENIGTVPKSHTLTGKKDLSIVNLDSGVNVENLKNSLGWTKLNDYFNVNMIDASRESDVSKYVDSTGWPKKESTILLANRTDPRVSFSNPNYSGEAIGTDATTGKVYRIGRIDSSKKNLEGNILHETLHMYDIDADKLSGKSGKIYQEETKGYKRLGLGVYIPPAYSNEDEYVKDVNSYSVWLLTEKYGAGRTDIPNARRQKSNRIKKYRTQNKKQKTMKNKDKVFIDSLVGGDFRRSRKKSFF